MGIMSWKRHILDKPAGIVMEQTAGVKTQISMLDLDLMELIPEHLKVMKLCVTALQPTFLTLVQLKYNVVRYQS